MKWMEGQARIAHCKGDTVCNHMAIQSMRSAGRSQFPGILGCADSLCWKKMPRWELDSRYTAVIQSNIPVKQTYSNHLNMSLCLSGALEMRGTEWIRHYSRVASLHTEGVLGTGHAFQTTFWIAAASNLISHPIWKRVRFQNRGLNNPGTQVYTANDGRYKFCPEHKRWWQWGNNNNSSSSITASTGCSNHHLAIPLSLTLREQQPAYRNGVGRNLPNYQLPPPLLHTLEASQLPGEGSFHQPNVSLCIHYIHIRCPPWGFSKENDKQDIKI